MRFRFFRLIGLGGVASALVAGCTSIPHQTAQPPPRPLGAEYASWSQDQEESLSESPALRDDPTAPVSLKHALAMTLLHNPELKAFSIGVRASEARSLQARVLPNPELEVEVGEFDRDGAGFDSAEMAISLGQLIELGGKRRLRAEAATAEGELAWWDYESKRLDVFTQTAKRFVETLAAQRGLELVELAVDLADKTAQAVGERVKAGKEPPFQAKKASAELDMARMEALEAENMLTAARNNLAAMWGEENALFQNVEGALDTVHDSLPSLEAIQARLSENPDLARWEAELKLREASLASEKAARIPDLELGVGLQRFEEDSTSALAFSVGTSLPLFNMNQNGIVAAKHDLAKAEAERIAARTTLAAELAVAHSGLSSAQAKVTALRGRVVPAMDEAFQAAQEGYRQGKFGYLDVLDAQRSLFDARQRLVDALADYHAGIAEIERIATTDITQLMNQ